MKIEELKKEYASQDNAMTAFPIYVTVQERICVGVIADGYSVDCPYGDGETKTEYKHPDLEDTYNSEEEIKKAIKEYFESESVAEEEFEDIEEINCGYIWIPVEFFLTRKGAEEYIRANAHNHGKLRIYTHHFERRNFEMRGLLKELGFKTEN